MTADHARAVREDIVDLAVRDGAAVALVHMVLRVDDLLVENIAVDPGHQGQGLGDALLRHAETTAKNGGRRLVRLYTNALMASNLAFYAARGYRVEHEERFPGGLRIHMAKAVHGDVA